MKWSFCLFVCYFSKHSHVSLWLNLCCKWYFHPATLPSTFMEWSLLSETVNLTLPQYNFLGSTYIFFISLMGWRWRCSISWYSCCPPGTRCGDTSRYWGHWKSSTGNSGPPRGKNTTSRWWWWRNSTPTAPMRNKRQVDERKERQEIMFSAHCIYTNCSLFLIDII